MCHRVRTMQCIFAAKQCPPPLFFFTPPNGKHQYERALGFHLLSLRWNCFCFSLNRCLWFAQSGCATTYMLLTVTFIVMNVTRPNMFASIQILQPYKNSCKMRVQLSQPFAMLRICPFVARRCHPNTMCSEPYSATVMTHPH